MISHGDKLVVLGESGKKIIVHACVVLVVCCSDRTDLLIGRRKIRSSFYTTQVLE
jgi:hypothetical protein